MSLLRRVYQALNPGKNPDLKSAFEHSTEHLPTLWLLGKTGAGKSSLIQALTGLTDIEVGLGFRPCTMTASRYEFPAQTPVLAFLDTRGLAEANYDAAADIDACENGSHALILVMKADDPEQSELLRALKQIKRSGRIRNALLIHTGVELLEDVSERQRSIRHQQQLVESIWGEIDSVAVDFQGKSGIVGLDLVIDKLSELMPIVAELFDEQENSTQEETNFRQLKSEIMWYAGAAGATDAVPLLGLVSVPGIQTKMLHSLANQYGLDWNRRLLAEFAGTLGASFGLQYASRLGLQQLTKLIPVYGQTVGAASAAMISYGVTYALGRAACMYFYRRQRGEAISSDELKTKFRQAFTQIMPVARDNNETSSHETEK